MFVTGIIYNSYTISVVFYYLKKKDRMKNNKKIVANSGTSNRNIRRVKPTSTMGDNTMSKRSLRRPKAINTNLPDSSGSNSATPKTEISCATPTPKGLRGKSDMRSPGIKKTPKAATSPKAAIPDFITQTDQYGNASTPRTADGIAMARKQKEVEDEPGDYLLESIRSMCCCFLPETNEDDTDIKKTSTQETATSVTPSPVNNNDQRIKLLPKHHPDDTGKKCLVLDLDETLVHSSFRAVPGADFVIPVQVSCIVDSCPFTFQTKHCTKVYVST